MEALRRTDQAAWLLLIHQLPAKPAYLRVKVGRKLQSLGAVALKGAVYALPASDNAVAGFRALAKEISRDHGEAMVCQVHFIAGLNDIQVRCLFDEARDRDYEALLQDARALTSREQVSLPQVAALKRRRDEIAALDFFSAHGRQAVDHAIAELERQARKHPDVSRADAPPRFSRTQLTKRVWVTRKHIHVDRIASAWLIRRFIDPEAKFNYVDGKSYVPRKGELRFDMANAEFTHEGNDCTFETLIRRTDLGGDTALRAIAEIIHDLDIEDEKFGRPETVGLGALITGVCESVADDDARLALASTGLNQFYSYFEARS
jgi:hypothetical protein